MMTPLIPWLLACTPEPPVSLVNPQVHDDPDGKTVIATFLLNTASHEPSAAAGALAIDLVETPAHGGPETRVCGASKDVPLDAFGADDHVARLLVTFVPPCPPRPPGAARRVEFTFTPTGGAAFPKGSYPIYPYRSAILGGPEEPPPPPPPAEVAATWLTPWPVAIRAEGATFRPDPNAGPTAPDAIEVLVPGCKPIGFMSAPTFAIGGGSIRLRLAVDGATFTVDDVQGDRWALEYFVKERYGLNYGVTAGDTAYLCRSGYVAVEDRDCAAKVCRTLFAKSAPRVETP